jgi:DNA-binding transcriptional LysR family regulator
MAAYSDLLAMLPVQWSRSPITEQLLNRIRIKETLVAPSLYMAYRAGLPLTPAAEYFCDLMRRAAAQAAPGQL